MPIKGKGTINEKILYSYDLPTVVFTNMKQFSNRPFLTDGLTGARRTFGETLKDALSIAVWLREMGIRENSYVVFMADTTIESFTFEIAVWLAGGSVAPINWNLSIEEVCTLVNISTASMIFCGGENLHVLEEVRKKLNRPFQVVTDAEHETYTTYSSLLSKDGSAFKPEPYDPDSHIVNLLFTSGTTGVPKGAMISSRACLTTCYLGFRDVSSTFLTSPLYWITNPSSFTNSLLLGTELIFPRTKYIPGTKQPDITHVLRTIQKYKPAKWVTGPSMLMDLTRVPDLKNYDLSSFKHISVGGSAVLPSQKKLICELLFNGRNIVQDRLGCTEGGVFCEQLTGTYPDYDDKKAASIGPLPPGVEVKIVDVETGKELGPNEVGELFVRTPAIMRGYINKDMPQRYTTDDWYRMGDFCMYDEDGWLYYKSRAKEMIKYRGNQMAPIDIEKVALLHPDVLEVCVIGKPHIVDGEHPVAFVVKKPNSTLTEDALAAFVNEQLSDEKHLRGGVIFKKELPKSSVGKPLRNQLLKEVQC
ncbi:AMP-Hypothetical protein enzyme [Nesidiocoris tenuis]|uniref:Luciferin 4-monooxygenase n=1 Tax=Nesidiocoris tenuis TaxID=355587 RepID=A0ABN7AFT4_9HEMI|nr:AMP-Hypothetical protein enzyme [Nesidiocoris tenuis]